MIKLKIISVTCILLAQEIAGSNTVIFLYKTFYKFCRFCGFYGNNLGKSQLCSAVIERQADTVPVKNLVMVVNVR